MQQTEYGGYASAKYNLYIVHLKHLRQLKGIQVGVGVALPTGYQGGGSYDLCHLYVLGNYHIYVLSHYVRVAAR